MKVTKSIIINRSPEEIYGFWRDFRNLPRFMRHLESVDITASGRSHWKAKGPASTKVEWDAEITEDHPNELIAWRSLEGADVPNSGWVRFSKATGGRGTMVTTYIEYDPPAGKAGSLVAKLFGEEPEMQVRDALGALKQVLETGEVVLSEATIEGSRVKQPAAQPPEQWNPTPMPTYSATL